MSASTERGVAAGGKDEKRPRLAYWIATALGAGYLKPAPGTWGSFVGVFVTVLAGIFWVLLSQLFGLAVLHTAPTHAPEINAPTFAGHSPAWLWLAPTFAALIFVAAIGVWSATRVSEHSGVKDPQFVVIDEVSGQQLALLLGLLPLGDIPYYVPSSDYAQVAIYIGYSLLNWKYLLAGFILFRVFDIWKPWPVHKLESLRSGWGIMADDWMAGVYAAILLRVALHFHVL